MYQIYEPAWSNSTQFAYAKTTERNIPPGRGLNIAKFRLKDEQHYNLFLCVWDLHFLQPRNASHSITGYSQRPETANSHNPHLLSDASNDHKNYYTLVYTKNPLLRKGFIRRSVHDFGTFSHRVCGKY